MFAVSEYHYQLIPSRHKHQLLMLDGYTFAQNSKKHLWYCSRKAVGCKARVKMDSNQMIIEANNFHCHERPNYYVTADGVYVLIK